MTRALRLAREQRDEAQAENIHLRAQLVQLVGERFRILEKLEGMTHAGRNAKIH
jgi:hypothetical protein